jgi:hypothetical protein
VAAELDEADGTVVRTIPSYCPLFGFVGCLPFSLFLSWMVRDAANTTRNEVTQSTQHRRGEGLPLFAAVSGVSKNK